jgi:predicted nucleic acid-binding protein
MHVGADSIRRLAVNFMPKGKTPDRRGLSGETAGDPKFSLPPSLSNTPTAGSQQRNQNQTRRNKVGEALRLLPLTDKETDLSPFISAFEMTYYAVIRRKNDQPASASLVEKQLNDMVRKCDKLEIHVKGMHRDALLAWAKAGSVYDSTHVAIDSAALVLILNATSERAEIAHAVLKALRRAAKKGSPPDAMAAAMRETAGFVYKKLTSRRAGRAYDSYKNKEIDTEFSKFLDRIYKAYDIPASARARARVRQPPMGNNSKK